MRCKGEKTVILRSNAETTSLVGMSEDMRVGLRALGFFAVSLGVILWVCLALSEEKLKIMEQFRDWIVIHVKFTWV